MAGGVMFAEKILDYLSRHGEVDTLDLCNQFKDDHQKIIGAVNSLLTADDLILADPRSVKSWELTKEGIEISENGSHEFLVWQAIPPGGIPQSQLMGLVPNPIGFSKAMSNGWISVIKDKGKATVHKKVESITDDVRAQLELVRNSKSNDLTEPQRKALKKRKLLQEVVMKSFYLSKGKNFSASLTKAETDLTSDMIASGSWKTHSFKPYNFSALGIQPDSGHLHPLLKVREEFRHIFLQMGFYEMATNNYVESSFWNFDALFQPQQHPARDAHDTFFINDPPTAMISPPDYVNRVKEVHSKGGYGSQGYGYDWKDTEAKKNLLRTHTTAVSARMLYNLANQKGGFKPAKYFSIDRVFRNETLDATHLAEFHQVEGVVADYNLTLGNLIAILHKFFTKLGLSRLKFKPAYNPYTEPSMEIFCFHPGLDKWVEIGNSGVFRPEMLRPMGFPENVTVIAWGLSLERPTMIKYGLNNIRDLVGPKVDLQMVYNNPICRLEDRESRGEMYSKRHFQNQFKTKPCITSRWTDMLEGLDLEEQNANLLMSSPLLMLTILVDPENWPRSLLYFGIMLKDVNVLHQMGKGVIEYCPKVLSAQKQLNHLLPPKTCARHTILLIWGNVGKDPIMIHPVSGAKIFGEVNIARYFAQLLGIAKMDATRLVVIDSWLDAIHRDVIHGSKESVKTFEDVAKKRLVKCNNKYLVGNVPTIVDIVYYSYLSRFSDHLTVETERDERPTVPMLVQRFIEYLTKKMD